MYAIHATRPDETGAVEVIFGSEGDARAYAADRSRDRRIVAVSVTSYVLEELGTRQPVAWYRDGVLQDERKTRPGAMYPASPWCPADDPETAEAATQDA